VPPEPPHRINQIYLEPLLVGYAAAMPGVTLLNRVRVEGFAQSADRVVATAQDLDSGEALEIECIYMVGCDGGRSEIRRRIGASLTGDAIVGRTQSTYIRAPSLIGRMQAKPAWSTQSMNPRRSANVFAIDGRETWLIHNYLRPEETDFDAVDRDRCLRLILGVGPEFEYEVLGKEDWIGRRMLADRFRDRRVFICGDAAHIWVPFGGYGMNAGIADATNLSWMLAGVLTGWADPAILDAYEAERWPITEQVSKYAMGVALATARERGAVPTEIEDAGPAGDAARAALGATMVALHTPQFCCGGLNFGSFYERSPIVAYDGEAAPGYTMYDFTPSTVPGCRTPHVWLRDGRSLYDAMGDWFTLLRFDPSADVDTIVAAARARRLPMSVLDVVSDEVAGLYGHKLVLSRPDQHVAWRGDAAPADALGLVDRARGAGGST
jgi:2-polyprenyl-6-methoxyphenol hydroxylase-like FAD-dependent oxidoreductase